MEKTLARKGSTKRENMENFCKNSPTHLDRILPEQRDRYPSCSSHPFLNRRHKQYQRQKKEREPMRFGQIRCFPQPDQLAKKDFLPLRGWGTTES